MIRTATVDDFTAVSALCEEFHKESKFPAKFDGLKVYDIFQGITITDDAEIFLYVADDEVVGMVVGAISSPLFSYDRMATELAWYVKPSHRGTKGAYKLMKAYEKWAEDMGCDVITMAYLENSTDVSNLYSKRGYKPLEFSYVKEV